MFGEEKMFSECFAEKQSQTNGWRRHTHLISQ